MKYNVKEVTILFVLMFAVLFMIFIIIVNHKDMKKLRLNYIESIAKRMMKRTYAIMFFDIVLLIGVILVNIIPMPEKVLRLVYITTVMFGFSELSSGLFGLISSDLLLTDRLNWGQMRYVSSIFNGIIIISLILIAASIIHLSLIEVILDIKG